jgi:hypothetical protein
MKTINFFTLLIACLLSSSLYAQTVSTDPDNWTVYNREVNFSGALIHLNAQERDGILWLNNFNFSNGVIELDLKGKNAPGQSFVGFAFHGQDNEEFDAVYFRPFNFKNPNRNSHSIQYISMPDNDWSTLRNAFPGKYENTIYPVPDPVDDWFHARIVVKHPNVKVYVNGSDEPTLEVEQISNSRQGKVGLWVGNGSEGWFKNISITNQ